MSDISSHNVLDVRLSNERDGQGVLNVVFLLNHYDVYKDMEYSKDV